MAQQRGFYVILRPGPYVCAEHDYGGLPWWLMSNGINNVKPRTSEPNYMAAVKRWLKVLMPKFVPLLYKNGGPIIAVQVRGKNA
jgi:beta-galactosidase